MKQFIFIGTILLGLTVGKSLAQAPQAATVETAKQKMKKLEFMIGKWKGEATVSQRGGAPVKVNQ